MRRICDFFYDKVSYQNLTDCLFLLLKPLSNETMKTVKLIVGEGWSVVTLHLQKRRQRANLSKTNKRINIKHNIGSMHKIKFIMTIYCLKTLYMKQHLVVSIVRPQSFIALM